MICLPAPVEVAIVDQIEASWALVELSVGTFVEVQTSRLPVGVKEGDEICFCRRPNRNEVWAFQSCRGRKESPKNEGRYFGNNEFY